MTTPTINDARWQEWTDKFLATECADPGADSTATIMGFFTLRREMTAEELEELQEDFSANFSFKVAQAHASRLGLVIEDEGLQFICLISNNLGSIVMNVHAARRVQQKLGVDLLTMKDLFQTAFENGLRRIDDMHTLWEEQKITPEEREVLDPDEEVEMRTDNYLDYVSA